MDFPCFAFRFSYVSIFHIKIAFSCIQISEERNLPQMNTPGSCRRETDGYFYAQRKGVRYGVTHHTEAGRANPEFGTKAVRQLLAR